jgi:hypothetical protein
MALAAVNFAGAALPPFVRGMGQQVLRLRHDRNGALRRRSRRPDGDLVILAARTPK